MINITQLCLSPDKGGLELYVAKLAGFLGDKVNLTVVIAKDSQLTPYFAKAKNPRVYPVKKSIFSAIKIAKIIDENNIDIIHIHWTKDLPIAVLAKLLSQKKPKLIQTRHMEMTASKNDFYHRFLYKNLDLMIAVTQQVKAQIKQFIQPTPKVAVSYIGSEKPQKITKNTALTLKKKYNIRAKFVMAIIGRIEHQKGQQIVVEAVSTLLQQGADVQLLIIGNAMDANYLTQFKQEITDKNLTQSVIFTDFVSNISEMVQLCSVVILATKKETFGMILIEAMQAGVCVVASDKGGPLEIIEHEKTGLLFKSFDSDDLADKLLILYQNPALGQKYAQAAKQQAEDKFNDIKQFNRVLDFYKDLRPLHK